MRKINQENAEKKYLDKGLILLDTYLNYDTLLKTKCYCGKIFYSKPYQIFSNTKSCGCAKSTGQQKRTHDLTSKKFGRLLVICRSHRINCTNGYRYYWKCLCDCGRYHIVSQNALIGKKYPSCGNCKLHRKGKRISKIQLELHKLLNQGVLNFKTGKYFIDIALVMNGKKIAIEYDSWKWHKNKILEDNIRIQELIDKNWLVLSIKSNSKLPTLNNIKQKINSLLYEDNKYIEIILEDWGVR